jgi:Flp pilus assembly protein CpaB
MFGVVYDFVPLRDGKQTMAQVRTPPSDATSTPAGRPLRRRRALPSGRAVVGGFLVALAAVGVFAAYTSATAGPTSSYAVAARDLAPGDRITPGALRLLPLDLPDEQRRRSYDVLEPLLDTTVVEPLLAGELVQEGSLIASNAAPGSRTVSFAIDAAHAVNGTLRAGERVDVLATFGSGGEACTFLVAGDVPLVAVSETTSSLVSQGGITVTLEADTADAGLAISHAANAGTVTLVRTTHATAAEAAQFCTPTSAATAAPADAG